ncbi:MAG: hypothetical protein ACFFG0_41665 [Candidatus Thorarchaeota archaeon]
MTNGGAISWLNIIKNELSVNPRESKRIAIDKAIFSLKENEKLVKEKYDLIAKCENAINVGDRWRDKALNLESQNRELVEALKLAKQEYDDNEFSGCMNTYGEICKVLEKAEGAE